MIYFIQTPGKHFNNDQTEIRVISRTNQVTMQDMIDLFESFLLAIGFSQETIDREISLEGCCDGCELKSVEDVEETDS